MSEQAQRSYDGPTIVVPSVKLSGADILVKHVLSRYPSVTLKSGENGVINDEVLYTKEQELLYAAEQADVVIVPIRHPKVVAKLWSETHEIVPDFFQMWQSIQKFRKLDNVVFLPMDSDNLEQRINDLADQTKLKLNSRPRVSAEERQIMELRAWAIEYDSLRDIAKWNAPTDDSKRLWTPVYKYVGEEVHDLVDDIEDWIADIYGEEDPEERPSRKEAESRRRGKRQKNTWKHKCPEAGKIVHSKKGEVCEHCGGEES